MPPMLQGLNTLFQLQGMGANRAQNAAGLGGADQQQPQGLVPPMPPVNIIGAFDAGKEAAKYADGGAVSDDDTDTDAGSGLGISPTLLALTKRIMAGTTDDSPTSEDKGLALAQAGFSIASGQSPHALSNIGAGASVGIDALQKLRQQRAVQRMKQDQMQQTGLLRVEGLQQAKQAAADKAAAALQASQDRQDSTQQRADAATQASADRQAALDARKDAAAAAASAASDRADALKETRYQNQAHARLEDYYKTGSWRALPDDKDHGVDGAPESGGYEGPLVTSPTISVKQKQALEVAKPKVTQATNTITMNLDHGVEALEALKTHPGLQGAVGFRSGQELIPGTDAASFKNDLNSVLSQQFAQAIQSMREASKTGGAVGNVSDREGDRFESMIAGLSRNQSEDSFVKNANKVIDYAKTLKNSWLDNYHQTYGELKPITGTTPPAGNAPPAAGNAPLAPPADDINALVNQFKTKKNVGPIT